MFFSNEIIEYDFLSEKLAWFKKIELNLNYSQYMLLINSDIDKYEACSFIWGIGEMRLHDYVKDRKEWRAVVCL